MNDVLKAAFTDEERTAAATVGEDAEMTAEEKTKELFSILSDPLLSAEDIKDLLGDSVPQGDVDVAVEALVTDGFLDHSTSTQRPLDPAEIDLYRRAGLPPERLRLIALEAHLTDGTSGRGTGSRASP